jgi:hypothetical protein
VIEALFDGCADTARDRTDSAISARAFAEFFESSGTAEIEWESKLSHDCTEEGSPRSFSSSFLIAICLDVRIGVSGSDSSSVGSEDSSESEIESVAILGVNQQHGSSLRRYGVGKLGPYLMTSFRLRRFACKTEEVPSIFASVTCVDARQRRDGARWL